MRKLLVCMAIVLGACESTIPPNEAMLSLHWLEGKWSNTADQNISAEYWTLVQPTAMEGIGFTLEGSDTLFSEDLQIKQIKGSLFYIANIGDGPVSFKLTSRSKNKWVFSNPEHDFPKRIIYNRQGDLLTVEVMGDSRTETFKFKKENGQ